MQLNTAMNVECGRLVCSLVHLHVVKNLYIFCAIKYFWLDLM